MADDVPEGELPQDDAPAKTPIKARRPGIPLRAIAPNAITALALCMGLTGIRYALGDDPDWYRAIGAIVLAAVLDGLDGRIARLLRAQSRFGAELDSLSDVIAFGVAPAFIMFLWTLHDWPRFGWICALAYAICCALRLARFNAQIDADEQPHKSAGFLTGVPAPAGAGLAFLPVLLWFVTDNDWFREPVIVGGWMIGIAMLMISNIATYSWSSLRIGRSVRLEAIAGIAIIGAALIVAPWVTLAGISGFYLALIPFSVASYAKVKRARNAANAPVQP